MPNLPLAGRPESLKEREPLGVGRDHHDGADVDPPLGLVDATVGRCQVDDLGIAGCRGRHVNGEGRVADHLGGSRARCPAAHIREARHVDRAGHVGAHHAENLVAGDHDVGHG